MYESKNDFRSYLEQGLYLKHYRTPGARDRVKRKSRRGGIPSDINPDQTPQQKRDVDRFRENRGTLKAGAGVAVGINAVTAAKNKALYAKQNAFRREVNPGARPETQRQYLSKLMQNPRYASALQYRAKTLGFGSMPVGALMGRTGYGAQKALKRIKAATKKR